ncbi:acyltransferase family protein [Hydrogenophaga sp. ZJX-1]|uniref:acyltransferase family protein n=1 Tax=Hydrogenophaga sp. ZJX-1 TaxID=3404778 RepID=UPI003B27F1F7
MEYRREVDGLRALAVLPVILFHAGFEVFSGGFVGVDVFFVISGYLITTIILSELEQGNFSIINFYERRARRILPALFLVMLVCLPFAWLFLLPSEMKGFAESLVAVPLFVSNILFWRESGYFDAAAELKPLLHIWSLSVEEQYYVIFPLFLILTWRLGKRSILVFLAIFALASLGAAHWGSKLNPAAAFYLLPTRVWELLIGAFVAFHLSAKIRTNPSPTAQEIGSVAGLGLLLYSVLVFDKSTPFPSLYTLVPTVGTALIILYASQFTFVGRMLGMKVFVGVGLISYSAYLWHQPLFAFARHRGLTEFDRGAFLVLVSLSLLLAGASWHLVERPFRSKKLVSRNKIFLLGITGILFFVSFGLLGHYKDGNIGQLDTKQEMFLASFENDLPAWNYFKRTRIPEKYRFDCDFYDLPKYRTGNATNVPLESISIKCFTSQKDREKLIFIWGDSHAQQLYHGLSKVISTDHDILQVASSGCVAKIATTRSNLDYCEYSNWFAFQKIQELRPKSVIIGQNLHHNAKEMKKISDVLVGIGIENVIFTGPAPHWTPKLPNIIAYKFFPNTPHRTFVGVRKEVLENDKKVKAEFFSSSNVFYLSLIDYFCNDDGCLVYYGDDVGDGITTWDAGHLAPIASYNFAKDVLAKYLVE